MKTKDFFFNLPEDLIAQTPVQRRGTERLLVMDRREGTVQDRRMDEFPDLIEPASLVVVNDSKVRKARVHGLSPSGAMVEFLFLEELDNHDWVVMTSKSKKQRIGKSYTFSGRSNGAWQATIVGCSDEGERIVHVEPTIDESFFEQCGHVPLPPYIKREDTFEDESRYQTVYASQSGSVAAPTAGLHFTEAILERIRDKGIDMARVTLHVGAGTFLPVRSESVEDHRMHWERYSITPAACEAVMAAKRDGRPIIAVGTTSVRTLESAWDTQADLLRSGEGRTNLFILPGYRFHVVDRLLTNFHTPESTLLMLVSAFSSKDAILAAYAHAVRERYRFFSYGDAMYIR
jgi:S-adenosylmethionine:tRNA ribosyltransferase-isomerase